MCNTPADLSCPQEWYEKLEEQVAAEMTEALQRMDPNSNEYGTLGSNLHEGGFGTVADVYFEPPKGGSKD